METYHMKRLETQRRTAALIIAVLFHLGVLAGVWYASKDPGVVDESNVEMHKAHQAVSKVRKV